MDKVGWRLTLWHVVLWPVMLAMSVWDMILMMRPCASLRLSNVAARLTKAIWRLAWIELRSDWMHLVCLFMVMAMFILMVVPEVGLRLTKTVLGLANVGFRLTVLHWDVWLMVLVMFVCVM